MVENEFMYISNTSSFLVFFNWPAKVSYRLRITSEVLSQSLPVASIPRHSYLILFVHNLSHSAWLAGHATFSRFTWNESRTEKSMESLIILKVYFMRFSALSKNRLYTL